MTPSTSQVLFIHPIAFWSKVSGQKHVFGTDLIYPVLLQCLSDTIAVLSTHPPSLRGNPRSLTPQAICHLPVWGKTEGHFSSHLTCFHTYPLLSQDNMIIPCFLNLASLLSWSLRQWWWPLSVLCYSSSSVPALTTVIWLLKRPCFHSDVCYMSTVWLKYILHLCK